MLDGWGTIAGATAMVRLIAPSMVADVDYLAWFARQQRHAVTRDGIVTFMTTISEYDVEEVLPAVRVPSLVLHRAGDTMIPSSIARHVASRIPGAKLVELPGTDHLPYVGEADPVVDAVQRFLAGHAEPTPGRRQLVTLVATDASEGSLRALVRRHVHRSGGREVTGDAGAVLAMFGTATGAVRCGLDLVDAARRQGVDLRVAVHTGECEVIDSRLRGSAARVPSALLALAEAGQVVASGTVRDVVPGSGLRFVDEQRLHLPNSTDEYAALTVLHPSQAAPVPGPGTPAGNGQDNVFRLDGEYWTLAFEGQVVTLRDSKGMRDLRTLLAAPGREFHVLDLVRQDVAPTPGTVPGREAGVELGQPVMADPVIDDEARRQYRHRLSELDDTIVEAHDRGDHVAAADAVQERDRLVEELTSVYGVGGRIRRLPDEVERARKAVRRRIVDALARIEKATPGLGRHLRLSVHTGLYCSYAPEHQIRWNTQRPPPTQSR